ncbi:PilZ domain-containing protein [bacterium]|nr:MAG: PilZ domain-containing protein [bacterium]
MFPWIDRRKHKRVQTEGEVRIREPGAPEAEVHYGRLYDLSSGGLSFGDSLKHEVGAELELSIFFDQSNIVARGRVAWGNKLREDLYQYGVEFLHFDVMARKKISDYVERF